MEEDVTIKTEPADERRYPSEIDCYLDEMGQVVHPLDGVCARREFPVECRASKVGGKGVFALENMRKGTVLCRYCPRTLPRPEISAGNGACSSG